MKEANEQRVRKATTAFAIITALLSLGHIASNNDLIQHLFSE